MSSMNSDAFWFPHSSSVDFCEPNYLLSGLVVEFWNTLSSFSISLFGVLGLLYSNPTREWRVSMLYYLLIVIGLGSAALHATLHWFAQSLDELPMLWFNVGMLYFLITLNSPLSERVGVNHSEKNVSKSLRIPQVALEVKAAIALILSAIFITYAYFSLQAYYGIFICGYILTILSVFLWTYSQVFLDSQISAQCSILKSGSIVSNDDAEIDMKSSKSTVASLTSRNILQSQLCFKSVIVIFGLVGAVCWVIDMKMCESSLFSVYTKTTFGLSLHIMWHIAAAYGGYLQIQTLILLRARTTGKHLYLHWFHEPQNSLAKCILKLLCLPVLCERKTLQKSSSDTSQFVAEPIKGNGEFHNI